jgi:hypothetical protein
MPTLQNITVKKYDNVTDVIYIAKAGATADGVPAIYQLEAGFPVPATRPTLKVTTRDNGKGTSRRFTANYRYPIYYTDANGKLVISGSVPGEFSTVLPQDMDQTIPNEAHQQFVHLLAHALMKEMLAAGQAAR